MGCVNRLRHWANERCHRTRPKSVRRSLASIAPARVSLWISLKRPDWSNDTSMGPIVAPGSCSSRRADENCVSACSRGCGPQTPASSNHSPPPRGSGDRRSAACDRRQSIVCPAWGSSPETALAPDRLHQHVRPAMHGMRGAALAVAVGFLGLVAPSAEASERQPWPQRTVRLITPNAVGNAGAGLSGWGARTRTWEWRNQNPSGSRYLSKRIPNQSDQEVSRHFGMPGRKSHIEPALVLRRQRSQVSNLVGRARFQ
jgi:hypothetical protein